MGSSRQGPEGDGAANGESIEDTLVTKFDPAGDDPEAVHGILTVLSGPSLGMVVKLDSAELVIGRDEACALTLPDAGLSRRHASLSQTAHGVFLRDLGSTNGTFVRAQRVDHARELQDGDRIQLGRDTVIRFSLQDRLEQEAAERMYAMTVRDPLTQLYNRRHLDERLKAEFAYASRHAGELCVLLVDVDHFKRVNDTYGHPAGDEVLKHVARGLLHIVRVEDLVARFGGEEFIILARGIDENGGVAFAERVRTFLRSLRIDWEGAELSVTVSVGVAHLGVGSTYESVQTFLSAADGALYRAKAQGRDRVAVAEVPTPQRPVPQSVHRGVTDPGGLRRIVPKRRGDGDP